MTVYLVISYKYKNGDNKTKKIHKLEANYPDALDSALNLSSKYKHKRYTVQRITIKRHEIVSEVDICTFLNSIVTDSIYSAYK